VAMKTNKKLRILILNYEFPPLGGGASPVSYEIAKGYVKLRIIKKIKVYFRENKHLNYLFNDV
jgi:hypothetical protein